MSEQGLPTPLCFGCGSPPMLLLDGGHQAWCGNDDCRVVTWDQHLTVDEMLEDVGFVELSSLDVKP